MSEHGLKLGALAAALILSGSIAPHPAQAGQRHTSSGGVQNTFQQFHRGSSRTGNSGSVGNTGAICACVTAVTVTMPMSVVNTGTIMPLANPANGTLLSPSFGQ